MQKCFVLDLRKCTGCQACQIACEIENRTDPGISWRTVSTFNTPRFPHIPVFHYSLACNHCLDAPCMKYCPALAISKDDATGAVEIDPGKCIGCKYCSWVCPYDAPIFNNSTSVMEKCTFCSHRLAEGKDTACVTGCPTGALKLGEFTGSNEEDNQNHPGFPNTGIKPALRLIPLREDVGSPSLQGTGNDGIEYYLKVRTYEKREKKITLRSEMALAIFTFLASILIGLFSAQMLSNIQIDHFLFLIAGAAGMGISISHLGKKFRAPRAIMNWKQSWISREIILFSTFLSVGWLYLFSHAESDVLGWFVAITGFAAAFSMDKVYDIAGRQGWKKMHSGSVLLTALFLTGVFAGNWIMVGWFGFMKLFLYTTRKKYFKATGRNPGVAVSIARIVLSSAIPLVIYQFLGLEYVYLMIASILVGEFIDRCEHYHEFELLTPQVQIDEDLITMVRKNQKTSG